MKVKITSESLKQEDGFPANIDKGRTVVVQIKDKGQGVVLYQCEYTGWQARCFLPLKLNDVYFSGLYTLFA